MSDSRLRSWRLRNQRLAASAASTPAEVVAWMCAVQAQDLPGARWAVAQRMATPSDDAVRRACDEGAILRTHVLRPTWHLVTAADIRWMLELSAARVTATCGYQHRQYGLTARIIAKSQAVVARALEGGRHQTRKELGLVLTRAGIANDGFSLGLLMLQAELDAVVCSGASRGAQQTYALLAERAPHAGTLAREEALAAIAQRYFRSHGPALVADFAWWSGLTVREARIAIALATPALERLSVDGREYWHTGEASPSPHQSATACLLPNFDEYTVAYRDRTAIAAIPGPGRKVPSAMDALANVVVLDGRIAATWQKTAAAGRVTIEVRPYRPLTAAESQRIARAARRYGSFLGAARISIVRVEP